MISQFNRLSIEEIELMHKAPILVSILIAGADGDIDRKEVSRAIELTRKKRKKSKSLLYEFYEEVSTDFEDKLRIIIQGLPGKEIKRSEEIEIQLSNLNQILPRLNKDFSVEFYKSLLEIAREVAHSSGGVLGISKVGENEARYLDLEMIKDPAV